MSENDELKDFMDELEGSTEDNQVNMDVETYEELPPITEEEFEQKLMSGVAMLLDNCNTVAHALKKRIESGDSFEGTVLGFAQATDNTIKTLKVLENRRNLKLKEDIENRKIEKVHKNRLEIEEKRNEGKEKASTVLTQNNTFVGDPDEFFKKMNKIKDKSIDV